MNVDGMLPFENMVADYVKETGYHVLYRVTPIFSGDELVARGVQIEAMSVEDKGEGISFNVFCYNVQPGITIDYATGSSELAESDDSDASAAEYVLNTNTKKFHFPGCTSVSDISQENRQDYTGSRDMLIAQGYSPCGRCNP
jgi:DNA-entry nuclease